MTSGLSQSQIVSAIMDAISALRIVDGGASYQPLEEMELEELVNRVQEEAPTTALNEEEPPQPSTSGQRAGRGPRWKPPPTAGHVISLLPKKQKHDG
ncbi:solute carrier family 1 protein [Echinococcus multilocularis]|uniref:Solute carrier family 1 protein n=1 Tax=Echinococcus multilocularis TaxID=6211 RepID=A0A0S4MHW9_ECHMU|nr:solute carrier family 1 protein [Echinococcus multilocularis]